jgi:hypothetical protein
VSGDPALSRYAAAPGEDAPSGRRWLPLDLPG